MSNKQEHEGGRLVLAGVTVAEHSVTIAVELDGEVWETRAAWPRASADPRAWAWGWGIVAKICQAWVGAAEVLGGEGEGDDV